MGVKGLLGFVQNSCANVCSMVSLRDMAARYKSSHPDSVPTIVVDALSCLRCWYTPTAWIHGGQWKEYLSSIQHFISTFQSAGIHLVFVFDGAIEPKKRKEWVRRRLRDTLEVNKIFNVLKCSKQQPGRNLFFIPSGIAIFTCFALKDLGQKIIYSKDEGDYEVAAYALKHNCLGILGEDSDYLIFDTVPYFSINNLRLGSLVTMMYSRENLCSELGLRMVDLPLLACLLGNDIIPQNMVLQFHSECLGSKRSQRKEINKRASVIRSVATFISKMQHGPQGFKEVEKMLPPGFQSTLLEKGLQSYVLPQQSLPWLHGSPQTYHHSTDNSRTNNCQDQEVIQIAIEEHCKGDSVMVYNVLCLGESECSNTLEDETDPHIPCQALVYRLVRQHIYAILLGTGDGSPDKCPGIEEWYAYSGNNLEKPEFVPAIPLSIPGGTPTARELWLSKNRNIQSRRFYTCMACFHVERWTEQLRSFNSQLAATCCLLIYLTVQVESLTLTDVEAFLAQALCLPGTSALQLRSLQLPYVDSRGVHLAFLFLRGLQTLMASNSACGYPFNMMDLVPWKTFDGKLFHQKYLLCHGHRPLDVILEKSEPLINEFKRLRTFITEACAAQNRILHLEPRRTSGPLPGVSSRSFIHNDQSYFGPQSGNPGWERNERHFVHHHQAPNLGVSSRSFTHNDQSYFDPQSGNPGWERNERHFVHHHQAPNWGNSYPFHGQKGTNTSWQNAPDQQANYQGQWSASNPSLESDSRGNMHNRGPGYGRHNSGRSPR